MRPPRGRAGHALAMAATCAAGWIAPLAVPVVLAQSSASPLELAWQAPPDCPSQLDVLELIRAHVPALDASPQRLQAFASVTRSGSKYGLVLALRGPDLDAQKQLELESCEAAAEAAALLIALALDPDAGVGGSPSDGQAAGSQPAAASAGQLTDAAGQPKVEPLQKDAAADTGAAAEPPRAKAAPTAPIRISAPATPPGESVELAFTVGTALALDLGTLPQQPAWGVRPWLAISVARLRVAGGLLLWLPGRSRLNALGGDVEGRAVGGDLSFGLELLQGRLALAPYGAAELLELSVSTGGISDPGSAAATWAALGTGLHGSYRLVEELHVTADASVLIPVRQARWLVRTSGADFAVFATPAATFRACVGLAYAFR